MKRFIHLFLILAVLATAGSLWAQMQGLHGDAREHRSGLHAGNQFRTTFYNDGTFGQITVPPDIAGEWPINSGHLYMMDGNVFVGSEVIDNAREVQQIISTVQSCNISYSSGDKNPVTGEWWTFLPLPGFFNPNDDRIAMSKWPDSWPSHWPDKADDSVDPGWSGKWNGYFGKNVLNADEESYFVADDYANHEFNFNPDAFDTLRGGLGIRMYVRGFQWSNALVEDALFVLFDLENIGTYEHDKMVFAYKFGNNMGDTSTGGDGNDDCGAYDKDNDVAYLFDNDDIGAGGFTPVGYFGGAFLESPGNHFDGIDNDGDGANGTGPTISESMFAPATLNTGDPIVVIDYNTFERTVTTMGADTLRIPYQDRIFKFWPGKTIEELPNNLVDDNLNGIIDESNGSKIAEGTENEFTTYLYVGQKYIDYFTNEGADNLLLDEKRDDGLDNDGDWVQELDDVGMDGVPFTGDVGEGDGIPTSGAGTDLPGEPHIDKTDIDETDMLGLTSFTLYEWPDIPHYDDPTVWANITPGYFDDLLQNLNVELLYGSGYFPSKPGQTERFSMGIMCGINLDDFLENKKWVSTAYNENYNFSKAPNIPTVTAIAGDNRVTLIWDDFAEQSVDPITGEDFEGYRIYRSTDPGWNDMDPITDAYGTVIYRKPLAQFDLDNEHEGLAPVDVKGVHFYLGDNTGITHTYIDSTAKNGFNYFYAVTAYDHGDPDNFIPPSETSKFISVNTDGSIDKGSNVVQIKPEAASAGFVEAGYDLIELLPGATTDGSIDIEVVNPNVIQGGDTYQVVFEDSIMGLGRNLFPGTKNFSLINTSTGEVLIDRNTDISETTQYPVTEGFRLSFHNVYPTLGVNEEVSGWNRPGLQPYDFGPYSYSRDSLSIQVTDYIIPFSDTATVDSSVFFVRGNDELPVTKVNFTVLDMNTLERVPFAFRERDVNEGEEGMFTGFYSGERKNRADEIIILTEDGIGGWEVSFMNTTGTDTLQPTLGDTLRLITNKPYLSNDVFEFTMQGEQLDETLAKQQLDDIRVVPNPYMVANSWEPQNPYANGRGPRELHFINLPPKCTIRIFNIQGQLVNTLEHETPELSNGTYIWDMQTKDNLDISYGIYIWHVDAGTIGNKAGKFAVIK